MKAPPLNALFRKDVPFQWTEACQQAFQTLKVALTNPPVLAYPDFSRELLWFTDACITGVGAVLAQEVDGKQHVISYAGRSLNKQLFSH